MYTRRFISWYIAKNSNTLEYRVQYTKINEKVHKISNICPITKIFKKNNSENIDKFGKVGRR